MADNTDFTDVLNLSTLGDKLKEARERKNLTISQANKQTHIHPAVLKALEDGNCENILNSTYVKSFLKKYSDFLGMDSARVLREYLRLKPEAKTENVSRPAEPKAVSKPLSDAFRKVGLLVAGIVVVGLISFAGINIYNKSIKPAFKHGGPRPSKAAVQDKIRRSGKTAAAPISKSVKLNLLLKVNQDVLVKVRTDGNLIFSRQLTKGTAEMFTADRSINIYVAKGEAIELILNNKPLGSPGNGLLENVEITRSGVRLK